MPDSILGLRTTVYTVGDLAGAKAWYAKAFELQPYYDQPSYVGFNVAGYELGLLPEDSCMADEPRASCAPQQAFW